MLKLPSKKHQTQKNNRHTIRRRDPRKDWQLYLFLVLPIIYVFIFSYLPMGYLVIAFKDYKVRLGIMDSKWVGLKHFVKFFNSYLFWDIIKNTLTLSVYSLVAGFPLPVLFALVMNSISNKRFKKITQTIVNLPHFISTVVLVSIMLMIFHSRDGIYGNLMHTLTGEYPKDLFASPQGFRHFYIWSGVWQGFGWGSIIYSAALSNVDPALQEAAELDGASRLQRVRYIDFPTILPTIVTMLILRMGSIFTQGFQKIHLMQNPMNLSATRVVSTYVYEMGISGSGATDFSYATAIGLFNNAVELILLLVVNKISKKVSETSLF